MSGLQGPHGGATGPWKSGPGPAKIRHDLCARKLEDAATGRREGKAAELTAASPLRRQGEAVFCHRPGGFDWEISIFAQKKVILANSVSYTPSTLNRAWATLENTY
jgi:hypothetical protein